MSRHGAISAMRLHPSFMSRHGAISAMRLHPSLMSRHDAISAMRLHPSLMSRHGAISAMRLHPSFLAARCSRAEENRVDQLPEAPHLLKVAVQARRLAASAEPAFADKQADEDKKAV